MHKNKYLITGGILLSLTPQILLAMSADAKSQNKSVVALNVPSTVNNDSQVPKELIRSPNVALNLLLERAQYWQSVGDVKRAETTWNKLLYADANNLDAIYGLALIALSNKKTTVVNEYLAKLKKLDNNGRFVSNLEQDIRLQNPSANKAMIKAQTLAESGNLNNSQTDYDEAIKQYELALDNHIPQGSVAVEYYSAIHMSSRADGFAQSRAGLERLIKDSPKDAMIQLALAKTLIRPEATRAEGIQLCFRLLDNPLVKGYAAEYARNALQWFLVPDPKYFNLFEAFLKLNPDDKEIRDQLNSGIQKAKKLSISNSAKQNGSASPKLSAKGLQALKATQQGDKLVKNGDVDGAIASYEASLKDENNDPWLRLKLAQLYLQNDEIKQARELMYDLPYIKTNQADILFARAIFSNTLQDWKRALTDINLISLSDRTQAIDAFRTQLLLREKVEGYIALLKQKKSTEASLLLENLLPEINQNLTLTLMVSNTLIGDGQTAKGLEIFQKAIVINANASVEILLSYADILLVAKQNVELAKLMGLLEAKKLSGIETQHYDDINFNFRLLNAQMLFENKQLVAAEQAFTPLLVNNASNPAVRGLGAQLYLTKADALLKTNDVLAAKIALEQSLTFEPNSPWVTFKLARLYLRTGQTAVAQNLVNALEKTEPKTLDNFYVRGLFSYEMQDWKQAIKVLNQVPAKQQSLEVKSLARSALIREQLELSNNFIQQGRPSEAILVLSKIEPLIDDSIDMLSLVANSYIDANQPERGLSILRQALAKTENPSAVSLILYANLLLKAKEDVELAGVLVTIESKSLNAIDQQSFEDLLVVYSVRQADILSDKGKTKEAEQRLNALLLLRPNDVLVNTSMAQVYVAMGDHKSALDLFKRLIAKDPNNTSLLMAAANVATTLNNYDYADACMQSAISLLPNDVEILTSAARLYLTQGKKVKAKAYFEQVLALNSAPKETFSRNNTAQLNHTVASNGVPTMLGSSIPLPASTTIALNNQIVADGPFQSSEAQKTQLSIAADITNIKQDLGVEVSQTVNIRNRKGESGTSKLTDIEAPIEVRFPIGDATANVVMTPVSLNAGSVAPLSKFGQGSADNTPKQESSGLGLSMSYKLNGFKADVGVTPLGFTYNNFTGGLKLEGKLLEANPINYMLNVSSRPVTDSLLSFAGATDHWGKSWGGVMANGARLQLAKDLGGYGVYGAVSYHSLNGHNVKSNNRTELEVGNYWELLNQPNYRLITGISAKSSAYKNNSSYFTIGHGGYFSPQEFYSISLPVTWSERKQDMAYMVSAGLSYNKIKQDAVNDFPNLPTSTTNPLNPAQSNTGLGYNLAALMEYKLSPHVLFDANLNLESTASGGYRQVGAGVRLTYKFEAMRKEMDLLLKPISATYGQ